jgi:hypothetical protein
MRPDEFVEALNAALQDPLGIATDAAKSGGDGGGSGGWVAGPGNRGGGDGSSGREPHYYRSGAGAGGIVGALQRAVEGPLSALVAKGAETAAQRAAAALHRAAHALLAPAVAAAARAAALTGDYSATFEPPPAVVALAPNSKRLAIDLALQQAYSYADWRIALVRVATQ